MKVRCVTIAMAAACVAMMTTTEARVLRGWVDHRSEQNERAARRHDNRIALFDRGDLADDEEGSDALESDSADLVDPDYDPHAVIEHDDEDERDGSTYADDAEDEAIDESGEMASGDGDDEDGEVDEDASGDDEDSSDEELPATYDSPEEYRGDKGDAKQVTSPPPIVTPESTDSVPIGESAAAAKDINSIDQSAIQRDPESYGFLPTTAPTLNDSPAAARPIDPSSTPTPTSAENSPKQSFRS